MVSILMQKFGLAVVAVQPFRMKGGDQVTDKNSKGAVILIPLAGKIPNRNVLAGTVAEMSGLMEGKSYMVRCQEVAASDEFGRQFRWTVISEASFKDILEAQKSISEGGLGDGDVIDVVTSRDTESQTETGDARSGGTRIGTTGRQGGAHARPEDEKSSREPAHPATKNSPSAKK